MNDRLTPSEVAQVALDLRAAIAEKDAEIATLTEHSVLANTLSYRIAVANGDATPPDTYFGDPLADLDKLIARIAELTALGDALADFLAGEILWGDQPDKLRPDHPLRRWREAEHG
jgi:hypothetical protein